MGYLQLILNQYECVHVLYTAYHVLECETNVNRAREKLECILQETQHSWFDKTQVPCIRYAVYHEQRFEYCVCSPRTRHQLYRATKLVMDLGWVDLVLTAPVAGGLQGQGSSKISDNSTQVRNLLGHPVDNLGFLDPSSSSQSISFRSWSRRPGRIRAPRAAGGASRRPARIKMIFVYFFIRLLFIDVCLPPCTWPPPPCPAATARGTAARAAGRAPRGISARSEWDQG